MNDRMQSERRSSKSYSFISEGSFISNSVIYDWEHLPDNDNYSTTNHQDPREMQTTSTTVTDTVDEEAFSLSSWSQNAMETSKKTTYKWERKCSVVLDQTWVDSELPGSSSSSPVSVQLHQENDQLAERRRSTTAHPVGFFNHLLYGSLRAGTLAELFSHSYCGLAVSAAATGFMVPFLADSFQPLLCAYLSLSRAQCAATLTFLKLPGTLSFFIGLVSDFYPIWSFHRKTYMLGGWIVAYLALMALVVVEMIDDNTGLLSPSVRTLYGGTVYVILMMVASFGVTVASVTALALLVELSQREPIHERGMLLVQYLMTRETATILANVMIALLVRYDEKSGTTRAVIPMKLIILIMAVVTLAPIPAVLFRLDEEPRQLKVDAADRSSLMRQLWSILQQEAVWRIILFLCCFTFLSSFRFTFVDDAVLYWANATPDAERVAEIPKQAITILSVLAFQLTLFNYSWIRISVASMLLGVSVNIIATIPTICNGVRSAWYTLSIFSLSGISRAALFVVTSLPIVEITEKCVEGATTGLVSSYMTLINMVVLTISDVISTSSTQVKNDFMANVIAEDAPKTRVQILLFVMANCGVNVLAVVPILYLLPRQKLEAQEMRTYGENNRPVGIAILVLFVGLVAYAGIVNLLALLNAVYDGQR